MGEGRERDGRWEGEMGREGGIEGWKRGGRGGEGREGLRDGRGEGEVGEEKGWKRGGLEQYKL